MNTCPVIESPNPSTSVVTAAIAAIGLTALFFWGLAQSSENLQPARTSAATHRLA